MNDVKLAEMMKNMPEDMVEESARFAGSGEVSAEVPGTDAGSKKVNKGGFRLHPALIAASVILIVSALTAVTVGVVKNLNGTRPIVQEGGTDDAGVTPTPVYVSDPTAAPTATPYNGSVELIDVSSFIGEDGYGAGRVERTTSFFSEDGETFLACEIDGIDELFEAVIKANETGNTGPVMYNGRTVVSSDWLQLIGNEESKKSLMIKELTPRELEGHARLFRCGFYTGFDLILIDGTLYYTLDRSDLAIAGAVMYDYDGNGADDILFIFSEKKNVEYYNDPAPALSRYLNCFYIFDMTKKEYVKVCENYAPIGDMPEIIVNDGNAYIWLSSSFMGGKIRVDAGRARTEGIAFSVGGADPDEFFEALYTTSTVGLPSKEVKLVFNLKKRKGMVYSDKDRPVWTLISGAESAELPGGFYLEIVQKEYDRLPVFTAETSDELILEWYWPSLPREIEICLIPFDRLMVQPNGGRVSGIYPDFNNTVTIPADQTYVVMLSPSYTYGSIGSAYRNTYVFILACAEDLPLPTPEPTEIPPFLFPTEVPTGAPTDKLPTGEPTLRQPTPTPAPTAIPMNDPKSVYSIADSKEFLRLSQDGYRMSWIEYPYIYCVFNGKTMDEIKWPFGPDVERYMANWTDSFKNKMTPAVFIVDGKESVMAVNSSKKFTASPCSGGEIVSVNVYAVNDAEDKELITFDLLAQGLSLSDFMQFAASSMDFRTGLNGEALPCFAIIHVKVLGEYIAVTGEYEYAIKQCIIPLI